MAEENQDYIKQEFKGKMYTVHSGNLEQIGWEFDEVNRCGVLRAKFKKGNTYDYWPVSRETFSDIFKQESKGSWFQSNIVKNKSLNYEKVD